MRKTCIVYFILMSVLLLNKSFAQNTIIADRPGIGIGSHVLASGIFQIESGLEFSKSPKIKQYKLGQILLRYGINLFEMQASLNSFVIQNISGEKNNGLQDLAFALKVPLTSGTKFTLSLLPKLNLPLGANFLTSNEYIPSVILLGDYSINNYLTFCARRAKNWQMNREFPLMSFFRIKPWLRWRLISPNPGKI